MKRPVYRIVDGKRVRVPGDVRDPNRRYSAVGDGKTGEHYDLEFTDEEERKRDEEEAQWEADRPKREAERKRLEEEQLAYRNSITYEDRLVLFLDILGWRDLISETLGDPEKTKDLGLVLGLFRGQRKMVDWRNGIGNGVWPGDGRVTHFSDCIVISAEANLDGRLELERTLSFLSSGFASNGIFIRGGITLGPLYHQSDLVFGPALIRAYELESKFAHYPRVILEPFLADIWAPGMAVNDKEGNRIGNCRTWRKDEDDWWFFDFLQPFPSPMPPFDHVSTNHFAKYLEHPKKAIRNGLKRFQSDPKVLPKYKWMAEYFNTLHNQYFEEADSAIQPISVD